MVVKKLPDSRCTPPGSKLVYNPQLSRYIPKKILVDQAINQLSYLGGSPCIHSLTLDRTGGLVIIRFHRRQLGWLPGDGEGVKFPEQRRLPGEYLSIPRRNIMVPSGNLT